MQCGRVCVPHCRHHTCPVQLHLLSGVHVTAKPQVMQLILFNHICVKLANVNSVAETCITTMWLMMIPELTENGNPLSFTTIQIRSNLSVLHFALPYIASKRVNLKTSNLAHWLIIACPTLPMKNLHWKGRGQGQVTPCRIFAPHVISPQRLTLETWNFVHGSAMSRCNRGLLGQKPEVVTVSQHHRIFN